MTSTQELVLPVARTGSDTVFDIPMPKYETPGAAGFDLCANIQLPIDIQPGERALIPTGFAMAIPQGFEGQVRPRSGLALKYGITVLNSPGTVDCDYRGEVGVILINHGTETFTVRFGDRIAQMVIAQVVQPRIKVVPIHALGDTERGSGGFGSTGHAAEPAAEQE